MTCNSYFSLIKTIHFVRRLVPTDNGYEVKHDYLTQIRDLV